MGATIRPVLVDFSMGEVDPKAFGRIDTGIMSHGALSMLNFFPGELGGASKRGGLQHCLELGEDTYMIPWAVSSSIRLLVLIQDGKLRFAYEPDSSLPFLLLAGDGSPLEIDHLDGVGGVHAAYAIADAESIRYAVCNSELSIVCSGYPPFHIRFASVELATSMLNLSYGIDSITGNVAWTPDVNADDELDPIPAADFVDAFHGLAVDTDLAATAESYVMVGAVKKTVTKIRISGSAQARYATVTKPDGSGSVTITDGETQMGTQFGHLCVATRAPYRKFVNTGFLQWTYYRVVDSSFDVPTGMTHTEFLEEMYSVIGDGGTGYLGQPDHYNTYCGTTRFHGYKDTRSVLVTFSDASTLSVTPASDDIKGSVELSVSGRKVSGGLVDSGELLDYTIPWMTPGKSYPCSEDSVLEGVACTSAVRIDSTSEPQLAVYRMGETEPVIITRDSRGKFGKLGVIVTPFYEEGDWPTIVGYHQNRKILGAAPSEPDVFYASKVNDFSNFSFFEEIEYTETTLKDSDEWTDPLVPETRSTVRFTQQIQPSSAMKFQLASEENEGVLNAVSYGDLFVGTATSEWLVPAGVDATNVRAVMVDRMGSSDQQARYVSGGVVYLSADSRRLRLFSGDKGTSDLMKYAAHIAKAGIVDLDFRQSPERELHAVLADGAAIVMKTGANGPAWGRIETCTGHLIKSVAILPNPDEDSVYFVVKRGSAYNLERLTTPDEDTFPTASGGRAHLDSWGMATVTVAGGSITIARFAGLTAAIHIDSGGAEIRGTIPFSAGGVGSYYIVDGDPDETHVPLPAGTHFIGLPFLSELETCRLDGVSTEGIIKTASKIHLRTNQTGSFKIVHRAAMGTEDIVDVAPPADSSGAIQYPYSGPLAVENPAGGAEDQTVYLRSTDGQPVGILVIAPAYEVGDSL